MPALHYADPPAPGYVASSLVVRDCAVHNGKSAVIAFAPGAMPNSISVAGLSGEGRIFDFACVPTTDELAGMLKGHRHPDLGPALSYGIFVAGSSGFEDNLPPVLAPFRHTVPDKIRRRCPPVAPSGSPPRSSRRFPMDTRL